MARLGYFYPVTKSNNMTLDLSFTEIVKIKAIAENRIQDINRYLDTWASPTKDTVLNEMYHQELFAYEEIHKKFKEAVDKY